MDLKMTKQMKKLNQKFRSIIATTIMCTMIGQNAYAFTADDFSKAGQTVVGLIKSVTDIQSQQAQITNQAQTVGNTQNLMRSFQPQFGPAQFFPECPAPQRLSNMPIGACEAPIPTTEGLSKLMSFQTLAKMSSFEYERASLGSIECIQNQMKAFNLNFTRMQNNLKNLQDQLKQQSQQFRDENDKESSIHV
jgi:conjugal transfer/entry exclusion protein